MESPDPSGVGLALSNPLSESSIAIGAAIARALAEVLPDELKEAIRPALTELQMLYTQHSQGGASAPEPSEAPPPPAPPPPGPAGGPGKLWTPGRG